MSRKKAGVFLAVLGVAGGALAVPGGLTQVDWKSGVTEGNYADPGNWVGGETPTEPSQGGVIPAESVTIKIPAGGIENCSTPCIRGNFANANVVTQIIDTTEGSWYKPACNCASDWETFMFLNGDSHYFNVENASKTGAYPSLEIRDGIIRVLTRWEVDAATADWTLESGVFDVWHPRGIESRNSFIVGGNSATRVNVRLKEGSSLRASSFGWRGCKPGSSLVFEGGRHEFSMFYFHEGSGAANEWIPMSLQGGEIYSAQTYIAMQNKNNPNGQSVVNVTNSAKFFGGNGGLYIGAGYTNNLGVVNLFNEAYVCSTGVLCFAQGTYDSKGRLELRDDSVFEFGNQTYLGWGNGGSGELILNDRAQFRPLANRGRGSRCNVYVPYYGPDAPASPATGRILVRDDAVFRTTDDVYLGWAQKATVGGECTGTLILSNRASAVLGYSLCVGYSDGCRGYAEVNDEATLETGTGNSVFVGGYNDSAATTGNVFRVNGGRVTTSTLCLNAVDSLVEINAGDVVVDGSTELGSRAGCENALLRMNGGTLSSKKVVIGKTGAGRVELYGGEMTTASIAGGGNPAGLVADGVTLRLASASADPLFADLTTAVLGANGIVLEQSSYDASVNQAFADAAGEDGLFVKRGTGTLTVEKDSPHAVTRVEAGTLSFAPGATQFGRRLEAADGTALALGDAEGLSVESLELGDTADGLVEITMAPTATIAVSGEFAVANVCISLTGEPTDGEFTVFSTTEALPEDLARRMVVRNMADGKLYEFTVDNTEGGKLKLSVKPNTGTSVTWSGEESGSWTTDANWSGDAQPGAGDTAVFPADAQTHDVTLGSDVSVYGLQLAGATPYLLSGAGSIGGLRTLSFEGGAHEIALPLTVAGNTPVAVDESAKGTVSGAISALAASVDKSGRGTLVLGGDNAAYSGGFSVDGGTLAGQGATAFGAADGAAAGITMKAGTLSVRGEEALSVPHGIVIEKSEPLPTVIDTRADLELKGGLSVTDGSWVKRGIGALDVTMGEGEFTWSTVHKGDKTDATGVDFSNDPLSVIDENGNVTGASVFAGVHTLEGALRVKGAGRDKTVINQSQWTWFASRCDSAKAPADLTLADLTYKQGGSGIHCILAYGVATPSLAPTFYFTNTLFAANTINLASGCGANVSPVFAVTNAEIVVGFAFQVPNQNAQGMPVVRLGPGAIARSKYDSQTPNIGAGWQIGRGEFHVDDGALMDSGATVPITFVERYPGNYTLSVTRGGTLAATGLIGRSGYNDATADSEAIFDGGRIRYYGSKTHTSMMKNPDRHLFTVEAGGLAMEVVNTAKYWVQTNGIAFSGPGRITKTGAGRLVWSPRISFVSAEEYVDWGIYHGEVIGGTTANVAGGIEVAEGSMELLEGSAPATLSVTVDSGCTLDLAGATHALATLGGAGCVRNGAITSCALMPAADAALTLEDVSVSSFTVDFGRTEESPVAEKEELQLARVGTGASLPLQVGVPVTVKAVNSGVRNIRRASVTLGADGLVTAVPEATGAFLLIR